MRRVSGHVVQSVGRRSTTGSWHSRFGRSFLSRNETLSIGKYCARAGSGAPRVDKVTMVIPGHAVVTGAFGTSDCSIRSAADSWPHPGLVGLPNLIDATPRGRRLRRSVSASERLQRCIGRWNVDPPLTYGIGNRTAPSENVAPIEVLRWDRRGNRLIGFPGKAGRHVDLATLHSAQRVSALLLMLTLAGGAQRSYLKALCQHSPWSAGRAFAGY